MEKRRETRNFSMSGKVRELVANWNFKFFSKSEDFIFSLSYVFYFYNEWKWSSFMINEKYFYAKQIKANSKKKWLTKIIFWSVKSRRKQFGFLRGRLNCNWHFWTEGKKVVKTDRCAWIADWTAIARRQKMAAKFVPLLQAMLQICSAQ